jgi:hypothetical protein
MGLLHAAKGSSELPKLDHKSARNKCGKESLLGHLISIPLKNKALGVRIISE